MNYPEIQILQCHGLVGLEVGQMPDLILSSYANSDKNVNLSGI